MDGLVSYGTSMPKGEACLPVPGAQVAMSRYESSSSNQLPTKRRLVLDSLGPFESPFTVILRS